MISRTVRGVVSVVVAAVAAGHQARAQCPGDISGDGRTDGVDLAMVLANWGTCTPGSAVSGVYPSWGPVEGGTPIAIVGVDLGGTASVTVDGVVVPTFSVMSSTVVTAVTPAGSVGSKAIELRNAGGQVIASASFLYAVTSLSWAAVLEQLPDPAVVINPDLRTAITATGLPWRVRDLGTGIEMLLIPPGSFQMGAGSSVQNPHWQELPQHAVTLTRPYYLGRYEVTQAQWQARTGSNPSEFQPPHYDREQNRPVERVSWLAVNAFLAQTGLRLPTEAEWERAGRAGTTTAFHGTIQFPHGTDDGTLASTFAWWQPNSMGKTRRVGLKAANGLGLHDMAGNVWEFCSDWFAGYSVEPQTDPTGPSTGEQPVIRGGAYNDQEVNRLRTSMRLPLLVTDTYNHVGFRVARNP